MNIDNIFNGQTIMQKTIDFSGYEKSLTVFVVSAAIFVLGLIINIIVMKHINDGVNYKIDAIVLIVISIASAVMIVVGIKNYFMKKSVEDVMGSTEIVVYRASANNNKLIEQINNNFYIIKKEGPIYYIADKKVGEINNKDAQNKIMSYVEEDW